MDKCVGSFLSPFLCFLFIYFLDMSDQVLRVFKADQQSRYIMIGKDTTAKEVVAQAIREFALTAAAEAYSLCEVSVTPEGVIKQRRLPEQLSKLADRIQLSGRCCLRALVAILFNFVYFEVFSFQWKIT